MKRVVGHLSVQNQLANMLSEGRFPHALLFHGPQGVGKRTLADALLSRLICGSDSGFQRFDDEPLACRKDVPAWHQLAAGSCPDAYILTPEDGKKSIGIKAVQSLLESLQRSADTARVIIVDSLEDLTPEASNTLLKTLEEPRKGIYFLLLAHHLSSVLPTIRSRCRLIQLHPLPDADVAAILLENGHNPALVPMAGGCPGKVSSSAAEDMLALQEALLAGQPPAGHPQHVVTVLGYALTQGSPQIQKAEAYRSLMDLQRKADALNLPLSTLNEAAYDLFLAARGA